MDVAQTLLAALDCDQLRHIFSCSGYKSQLDDLRDTIKRIKVVLEDAESQEELSNKEKLYVEELKDAVSEADDILDEFVTLAERKQLNQGITDRVFSFFTKFGTAYNTSQMVMKIKDRLDAIASDKRIKLSIDPRPVKKRRLETCSYVYDKVDIIGRGPDLGKIVGMLLNSPNVQQNVSFLTIVGVGGLGKTALAQLVYNDDRVTTAFPLRLWTCVADDDQRQLDVQGVLVKILAAAENRRIKDGYTMDVLQRKVRENIDGKKFLLVLDDVWTEDPDSWHNLIQFLMGGQRGSWIVVTTRSQKSASIIGDGSVHNLQGLTKENSWRLFKKVAFGSHLSEVPGDLVRIGEDIVEKCANVPLAIKVVGSLLDDQDKQTWLSIQKLGLAQVEESRNRIMPILKLSYYKLDSMLKSCFRFCVIFPKDYEIEKDTLISLWMAHGYIPLNDPRSPEDLGEKYFFTLLQRCFFQDVKKDEVGNIRSCKIHDLMHDLAQQMVGKEICTVKTMNGDVDEKVRHLSRISNSKVSFIDKSRIRSYLDVNEWQYLRQDKFKMDQVCADSLIGNWKYLRALDLRGFQIKSLTSSVGELIHLRYLDLSDNECLEVLPRSITKLYNLLTLKLRKCDRLKELSDDLQNLVKLRALDLYDCNRLKYMPRGMGKLSCLHNLTWFVVGDKSSSKKEVFDRLKDLKDLSELRGSLTIRIPFRKTVETSCEINSDGIEGGCLGNKEYLTFVHFWFDSCLHKERVDRSRVEYDEAVMEKLLPLNYGLKSLVVSNYSGVRMTRWPREDNTVAFLPYLVTMEFFFCVNLQNLGKIRLPQLKTLCIQDCKNLIAILECPALEHLKLENFNERLKIIPILGFPSDGIGPKLRDISIDNVSWLNSLPMNPFQYGAKLSIEGDNQVESLGEAREGFRRCSSSLKYLKISFCSNLQRVVCEGLEHLSALEYLEISDCDSLSLSEEVEGVSFSQSLHTLKLTWLHQMKEVPSWIQYLSALKTLHIRICEGVESMPDWMSELTSLEELQVTRCSERLYERCQESTGEDWPHIEHIPFTFITKY